jgi:hypothetical protein
LQMIDPETNFVDQSKREATTANADWRGALGTRTWCCNIITSESNYDVDQWYTHVTLR